MASMADRDGLIWYDGKLVPWRNATTHVLTHTLHYGMGVFEGVRAYKTANGTAIFRLQEHTDRLFNSAHIYGMKIPYDKADAAWRRRRKWCAPTSWNPATSARSRSTARKRWASSPKGVARARGDRRLAVGRLSGRGSARTRASASRPPPTRAITSTSTMCRAKSVGTYMPTPSSRTRKRPQDGYDEALLLDVDGFVAEGSGENIFIVKNGKLYEPELTSALEGITRDSVITHGAGHGHARSSPSASPATRSIAPTRRSSPARPPK